MNSVNFLRGRPGGVCFTHGPHPDDVLCPKWPACTTDPQKPEYLAMGANHLATGKIPDALEAKPVDAPVEQWMRDELLSDVYAMLPLELANELGAWINKLRHYAQREALGDDDNPRGMLTKPGDCICDPEWETGCPVHDTKTAGKWKQRYEESAALVGRLREALEPFIDRWAGHNKAVKGCEMCKEVAAGKSALSLSPTEALREHDERVLSDCAEWITEAIVMRRNGQTELEAVAEAIRVYARAQSGQSTKEDACKQ